MREVVIKKIKLDPPEWGMGGITSSPVILMKVDHYRKTVAFFKIKGSNPDIMDIMALFWTDKDLSKERTRFLEQYNRGAFNGCTTERIIKESGCEYLHLRYSNAPNWALRYTSPKFSLDISMYDKVFCNGDEWKIDDFLLLTAETGWWPEGKLQKPVYLRVNKNSLERQELVKR